MPKCTIDGKEVEFQQGENLVNVAKRAGVDIPVFCYHPGLSVVAQCRMCLVEVEKMPKLQTACSTGAAEGMIVRTQADTAVRARAATMEFLLVNHPLDCPICDKSGECDLQDNSYKHGHAEMRTTEERRTYVDVDMGPVIQKNMNRCIHCTRCIRFGDEVAGIREMVAVMRGNHTDITTIDGKQLETEYAGNYADICPTGALTLKDFRFKKRVWFLKKTPTICDGCSKGCNIEVHHEAGIAHRVLPRFNDNINKYWLCDEGRFRFRTTQGDDRIIAPMIKKGGEHVSHDWSNAIDQFNAYLSDQSSSVTLLLGTDLTNEEMLSWIEFSKKFKKINILSFGTEGLSSSQQDGPADALLKMKSKTANLKGAEKLSVSPKTNTVQSDLVIVASAGRAVLPKDIRGKTVVGVGVFYSDQNSIFDLVLPSLSFLEKNGTFINYNGTEQKIRATVPAKGLSKPLNEILMMSLAHKEKMGAV